jgi:hypothetical protein
MWSEIHNVIISLNLAIWNSLDWEDKVILAKMNNSIQNSLYDIASVVT